ncbi:PGBD5 [Cordylochernes scorpioides]|uniref:PGBD5 n=1 Tax=Cordylochernes scorpioides TaxID=51811 RepID=A0ABY6KK04_9ARAC|nr:PGBD5 [Cordylochernes scorpioides]
MDHNMPSTSGIDLFNVPEADEEFEDYFLADSGSELDDSIEVPQFTLEGLESDTTEIYHEESEEEQIRQPTPEDEGWTEVRLPLEKPTFSGTSGPKAAFFPGTLSPYSVFKQFFDEELFRTIKLETNKYARMVIDKERKKGPLNPRGLLAKWKAVSIAELKIFLAIIIHMSLVVKPRLREYWSNHIGMRTAFCKSTGMARERFEAILSMLHLNDNMLYIPHGQPGYDPIYKIRTLFDSLVNKFRTWYSPDEKLTIDEAICPFRGRVHFRVYIKSKPHKYGIKIYEICESSTGYTCNLDIYTGRHPHQDLQYNSILSLVDRIAEPYYQKGHIIYFDSQLLALKWRDTRDVFMIATTQDSSMIQAQKKIRRQPQTISITKPAIVVDYNKNKAGVDRSDQFMAYYPFHRRTLKWWKKLFFHIFGLTIVNSHIVYNKLTTGRKMPLREYHLAIMERLMEEAGTEILDEQPSASGSSERLIGKHFLTKIPATGKTTIQKRCKVCSDKGKRSSGKRQFGVFNQRRGRTSKICYSTLADLKANTKIKIVKMKKPKMSPAFSSFTNVSAIQADGLAPRNLRNFGYPLPFIDQHCYNPSHHRTQQTFKTTCYIDYSPTNLKIALEMKKYGIKFFFRTPRTIGNILRNPITKSTTDQNPLQKKNAIYSVSCIDCPSIYVGETSRKIQTRLKEHTYNMKTKDPRSLIFQHTMNTGHKFNLDSPTCHYSNITTKSERLILESLISKQHNSINRRIDIPEQFCHIPYHKNQISRLSIHSLKLY